MKWILLRCGVTVDFSLWHSMEGGRKGAPGQAPGALGFPPDFGRLLAVSAIKPYYGKSEFMPKSEV